MGRMGLSLASGVMSVAGITRRVLVVGAPTAGMSWKLETVSALGCLFLYDERTDTKLKVRKGTFKLPYN